MKRQNLYKLLDILHERKMGLGVIFSIAHGDLLDRYGEIMMGIKRKRWWIFKETDNRYKARLLYHVMVEKGYMDESEQR